jgi:hypothetical protein
MMVIVLSRRPAHTGNIAQAQTGWLAPFGRILELGEA